MLQISGGQNIHWSLLRVIRNLLQHGRTARLQPFNEYRKKFDLKPYKSFSELTGKCRKPKLLNCCLVFNFILLSFKMITLE